MPAGEVHPLSRTYMREVTRVEDRREWGSAAIHATCGLPNCRKGQVGSEVADYTKELGSKVADSRRGYVGSKAGDCRRKQVGSETADCRRRNGKEHGRTDLEEGMKKIYGRRHLREARAQSKRNAIERIERYLQQKQSAASLAEGAGGYGNQAAGSTGRFRAFF